MQPRRDQLSDRFRPQFMWTLDQIALILSVPYDCIFDFVWTPFSKTPPKGRMQAVVFQTPDGKKEIRVPETQLNEWADNQGYRAMRHLV